MSIPTTAIAFCAAVADIACSRAPCQGAPGQLIAGGAGARPDHPINGHDGLSLTRLLHFGVDGLVDSK
jgi:hypothetical protein